MPSHGAMKEMAIEHAKKPGKKVLEEIRLKRGIDGGITATHHYSGFEHEPKAHELANRKALHAHLDEHMALGEHEEMEE